MPANHPLPSKPVTTGWQQQGLVAASLLEVITCGACVSEVILLDLTTRTG
jgi:hypothetical protein